MTPPVVGVQGQVLTEAVERAASPVLEAHGLSLVDLEVARGGRRSLVRFFVDKPGGVTVDDCRRFSEEIGDLLDVTGGVPGAYDLEVSSPGLDRELRKDRELRWAIGRPVRVWTREPVEGRRERSGRLTTVESDAITLADGEGACRVPRALVDKIRLDSPPAAATGRRR